jgi:predicted transcriptional regulator
MMRTRAFKVGLMLLAASIAILAAGAWMLLRVEDIPEQLLPVVHDPDDVVIESSGPGPDLALARLRGKTAFFILVGPQTADSNEGEALNRALSRWEYPDTTEGYIIGDAEGFGVFRERIDEVMQHFAREQRFPLFVDYEGAFVQTFQLPKGHHGFVVLGPDGRVEMRRSGGVADIQRVRTLLGASEPPPGPPAPSIELGPLDDASCRGVPCVVILLGREVARTEIPFIEDGFDGDKDARLAQLRDPDIRLVASALEMQLDHALGVLVGVTPDLAFDTWTQVEQAPDVRQALGLAEETPALIIIEHGRIAFSREGFIPLHAWGRIADLLGVEINDRKPLGAD